MPAVFKRKAVVNKLFTVSFDGTSRYWLLKPCTLSNRTEKAHGIWFKDVSSERTGSMLRWDSKFCSRACNCTLLWWYCSCRQWWISGFSWEINGEKPEIHFVHCCANVPDITVSRLAASGRSACIFLSVPCRLSIWKILGKANLCYFTEATLQKENCHELQHCDSDFNHKLIIWEHRIDKTEFAWNCNLHAKAWEQIMQIKQKDKLFSDSLSSAWSLPQ